MPGRAGLVLLIVLAAALPAAALDPGRALNQYSRQAWRSTEGLPQNTVSAIVQTRDGYLWLATFEGVARFDGVRFAVFDHSNTDAMTQNHISALLEARDGTLWLGTYGGGLLRYRDRRFSGFAVPGGGLDHPVTALAQDRDGGIWAGTAGGGVFALRGGRATRYSSRDGLPSDQVMSLAAAKDGGIWVGTTAGLARIARDALVARGSQARLPSASISALLEDPDGVLWVGTPEGLARLAGASVELYGRAQGLAQTFVRCVYRDREDTLWAGTSGGLYRLHDDGRFDALTEREGLSAGSVVSLREDREGSLWIGTDGGGLNRLTDGKVFTLTTADGLSTDTIQTIAPDKAGGLWIGGNSPDLIHLRGDVLSPYRGVGLLAGNIVLALFQDSRDRLWIGTDRGLYLSEEGRLRAFDKRQDLPEIGVRAIAEGRDGAIWVGTENGGLLRYANGRFAGFGLAQGLRSNEIRAIHLDRAGDLWVATYGGLSRLDGSRFVTYVPASEPGGAFMRSIHEDTDGTLWLGTYGGGLHRFRDGRFATVTSRQGLASDVVYQVLEDDEGRLWMSSNKGIFHVGKGELDDVAAGRKPSVHSTLFGEMDGMRSRECNGGSPAGWKTADGRLWFPTLGGVVVVEPRRIVSNSLPPPVVLEEAIVDDRALETGDDVRVEPGSHRLEFRYTGLSLAAPQAVRFSYRLQGFDATWVDAGSRRSAFYTSLPPGPYRFEVRAANEDGVWSPAPASLDFTLLPRFYETPWFSAACVLAAGLAGLGAHRWRTSALRQRERDLAGRVQEALARVKTLSGLLPICASCKMIRDDQGYWNQIETFVSQRSAAEFTHSLCPDCVKRLYPEQSGTVLGKD